MTPPRSEVPYGTLDLLVLKTLHSLGPLHGFGIARRLELAAGGALFVNQGTLYPALLRLEQRAWISSSWGPTENNRKAKFYALTPAGLDRLAEEERQWNDTVALMRRVLEAGS